MRDNLKNILLDQVSMQFFLSNSLMQFSFSFKIMLYKIWTHKSHIEGFSFTYRQVGQQWVSLGDMCLDKKTSTDFACSEATSTQAHSLHR
jgi:hypothetical protein